MAADKMPVRGSGMKQTLLGLTGAVMLVLVVTGALHMRVANTADLPDKAPLPVATTVYQLQESFQRDVSYLGVVAAGRRANLAFEVPGRIASLPMRQGSPVAAGEIIATLDDSRLQSARRAATADLTQAEANLELARLKAKRQGDLVKSGSVSREAFDETRLQAQALQARVESITARLESIDIDLQDSQLVAPYDGVIADRYLNEGTVVSAGQPVVRLVETDSREAHIGVVAERAAKLQEGRIYNLNLRGEIIEASLLSVRPDIDPVTRVATAVFALPAGTEALDGEPIYFLWEETIDLRGGWLPLTALLEGERGVWTLMRLEPDGQDYVALREGVEVLELRGEQAYVIGTVSDGDKVVSMGAHRVVPGTPVSDTGAH